MANGGRIFHRELEEELAEFVGKEACHVFSAGYLACASAVTGFVDRKDVLFADKNLHSSLWSGIKLSGARCERFSHNQPVHLKELLEYEERDPQSFCSRRSLFDGRSYSQTSRIHRFSKRV